MVVKREPRTLADKLQVNIGDLVVLKKSGVTRGGNGSTSHSKPYYVSGFVIKYDSKTVMLSQRHPDSSDSFKIFRRDKTYELKDFSEYEVPHFTKLKH